MVDQVLLYPLMELIGRVSLSSLSSLSYLFVMIIVSLSVLNSTVTNINPQGLTANDTGFIVAGYVDI
jgi:hypothetical protein